MSKEANRQPPGKKVATPSRQSRGRGSKVSGVLAPASCPLSTNTALTTLYWQIGVRDVVGPTATRWMAREEAVG